MPVLAGVTLLHRFPPAALVIMWQRQGFRQIEYRIRCHNGKSLRPSGAMNHPLLAFKVKLQRHGGKALENAAHGTNCARFAGYYHDEEREQSPHAGDVIFRNRGFVY